MLHIIKGEDPLLHYSRASLFRSLYLSVTYLQRIFESALDPHGRGTRVIGDRLG
jgi:hypothetical protein